MLLLNNMIKKVIHKKLSSFTLTEVIVAMIIMSLLAVAAYSIFMKTGSILSLAKNDQEQNTETMICYSSLMYDVSHAQKVEVYNNSLFIDNEIKADVLYELYDNFVVRKVGYHSDTCSVRMNIYPNSNMAEKVVYLQIIKEHDTIDIALSLPQTSSMFCNEYLEKDNLKTIWK